MPQPKIYAAVLNHFGSLSDLAATLGATCLLYTSDAADE